MTNMIRLNTDELFSPRHLSMNSLLSRRLIKPITKHRGESVKTCATHTASYVSRPCQSYECPLLLFSRRRSARGTNREPPATGPYQP